MGFAAYYCPQLFDRNRSVRAWVSLRLESLFLETKAAPNSPAMRRLGGLRAGVDLVSRV